MFVNNDVHMTNERESRGKCISEIHMHTTPSSVIPSSVLLLQSVDSADLGFPTSLLFYKDSIVSLSTSYSRYPLEGDAVTTVGGPVLYHVPVLF